MKKGNLGGKIFFLLFFGLFICTVGGSLLDSCIKLYKVNKIYTDTCTVKCTDYEYSDQYEDNSSDDYNRSRMAYCVSYDTIINSLPHFAEVAKEMGL